MKNTASIVDYQRTNVRDISVGYERRNKEIS